MSCDDGDDERDGNEGDDDGGGDDTETSDSCVDPRRAKTRVTNSS